MHGNVENNNGNKQWAFSITMLHVSTCSLQGDHCPSMVSCWQHISMKHTYLHQPSRKIRRQIRGLELLPHLWPTSLGFGFGFCYSENGGAKEAAWTFAPALHDMRPKMRQVKILMQVRLGEASTYSVWMVVPLCLLTGLVSELVLCQI